VSGLGLRTIRRIESTGNASYESARALAAVLELDVARLRVAEPRRAARRGLWLLRPMAGLTAAAILAAVLVARNGFADEVRLDFTPYEHRGDTDVPISRPAVVTIAGEEAGIGLSLPNVGTFRMSITPRPFFVPALARGEILKGARPSGR
jgi:hypothetical protein